MSRIIIVLVMLLLAWCAVRYKSGVSCWSAEMISTENWCKKQRAVERQPPMSFDLGPTEYGKGKP